MTPAPKPDIEPAWKCGNEFAPYHPQASQCPPDWRDGWNACYAMGAAAIEALRAELEEHRAAGWALMTETSDLALGDKDGGPEAVIDNIIVGIKALEAERDAALAAIVNWYACHEIDTQADDETITESERALEAIARAALAAKEAPNAE